LQQNQESANSEFWRFNNFVLNELDKVAPLKCKRVKGIANPWLTAEVRYYCKLRDIARKIANLSNNVIDIKLYRKARIEASCQISKATKSYFFNKFQNKVSSQTLWDTVTELAGFRKKDRIPISVCKETLYSILMV
jgi:hypothetical protein